MAFDLQNFLVARGPAFTWNEVPYTIDRVTVLHWPDTRLIALPHSGGELRVTVNADLFLAYAQTVVCSLKTPQSTVQQCQDVQDLLVAMGCRVWTVQEAVETVTESPENEMAKELIECLEQWFFVRRRDA